MKAQVIPLMITDGKKWHYLAVKSLSRLLQGIASNHDDEYYCMNCLYSFRTENKLKSHENLCKDYNYCHMIMLEKDDNILKYNQGKKSFKTPFVIYTVTKLFLIKICTFDNKPEGTSRLNIRKHTVVTIHFIYTVHLIATKGITIFAEVLTG